MRKMDNKGKNLRNTVFVVMPFSDNVAEAAYNKSIRQIISEFGMSVVRADEIFSANPIFDDIVLAIEQAALVVVDISGRNPNCFYELGIAHTLKRSRTIMVTHDDFNNTPFDIAHFRIIQYTDSIAGKAKFEEQLRKTINSVLSGIPEVFSDEFEFLVKTIRANELEYKIWGLQGIALASRPLTGMESGHVEGTCPGWPQTLPGMGGAPSLADLIETFAQLGYVHVVAEQLVLSDKGRAFADYATSIGYQVYMLNDLFFVPEYVPVEQRGLKFKVAPEPK